MSYQSVCLADGALAFWPLDSTAGTDASGNGHTLTPVGTFAAGHTTPEGYPSLHFGGAQRLDAAVSSALNFTGASTVELLFWYPGTSAGANETLAGNDVVGSTGGQYAQIQTGTPKCYWSNGTSSWVQTTGGWSLGTTGWHHIAIVYGPTSHQGVFWLDGVGRVGSSGAYATMSTTTNGWSLGGRRSGSFPEWLQNADLAGVALYNYELSSAQIAAHYAAGINPVVPPCPYGTRIKTPLGFFQFVTDALVEAIKTFLGITWIGAPLAGLIGQSYDLREICSGLPPPVPAWDPTYLIGNPTYPTALFKSLVCGSGANASLAAVPSRPDSAIARAAD